MGTRLLTAALDAQIRAPRGSIAPSTWCFYLQVAFRSKDEPGHLWASQQTMADEYCMPGTKRRTVRRYLAELLRADALEILNENPGKTTTYLVTPDRIAPPTPGRIAPPTPDRIGRNPGQDRATTGRNLVPLGNRGDKRTHVEGITKAEIQTNTPEVWAEAERSADQNRANIRFRDAYVLKVARNKYPDHIKCKEKKRIAAENEAAIAACKLCGKDGRIELPNGTWPRCPHVAVDEATRNVLKGLRGSEVVS